MGYRCSTDENDATYEVRLYLDNDGYGSCDNMSADELKNYFNELWEVKHPSGSIFYLTPEGSHLKDVDWDAIAEHLKDEDEENDGDFTVWGNNNTWVIIKENVTREEADQAYKEAIESGVWDIVHLDGSNMNTLEEWERTCRMCNELITKCDC